MRIIVVEPQMKPKIQHINGSLASMQDIVGGTIQAMYPYDDAVALVVNDEGKVLGLPMNRALRDDDGAVYDIVHGTFFICGLSEDSFASLTDEQLHRFIQMYATPELFLRVNNQIVILPMLDQ